MESDHMKRYPGWTARNLLAESLNPQVRLDCLLHLEQELNDYDIVKPPASYRYEALQRLHDGDAAAAQVLATLAVASEVEELTAQVSQELDEFKVTLCNRLLDLEQ